MALSAAVLRQVVYNLVQNAIDASPQGGTVLVAARVAGDVLELRVSDSGARAPSMSQLRMPGPAFGTQDERTGMGEMGLGLALVRQTINSAGGTIQVDVTASGGAEFIATLPLATREVRT